MPVDIHALPPLCLTEEDALSLQNPVLRNPDHPLLFAYPHMHLHPTFGFPDAPDYRLTDECRKALVRAYREDVFNGGFLIGTAAGDRLTVHTLLPAPGLRKADQLLCKPEHFAPVIERKLAELPGSQLVGIWYSLPGHLPLFSHCRAATKAYAAALGGCLSIQVSCMPVVSASWISPDGVDHPFIILSEEATK